MDKIFTVIFCLSTLMGFGQTTETYKFSQAILAQIDKDSVAWKYQTGAAELSLSGHYHETLNIWDKNGVRPPVSTEKDSLLFVNCKKINAKDYIIEQSKNAQIIVINEAHHISKHRTFTRSLLKDLYDNGYRYLGLEALFDSTINERKFATIESGYYTKEPEFGNMISEALNLGFILFGYEASQGKNGREREIEQAENIQKFIESVPKGKVLIHCGFAHAFENDYPSWGKAMAGRLKENMNIDPLTVDQTMFVEKSDPKNNHLFIRLNQTNQPLVLVDEKNRVFNGLNENTQTDIVVIHPQTPHTDSRPQWLLEGKEIYNIPQAKIKNNPYTLVMAYRQGEFENNGIPADLIEITSEKSPQELYLNKGKYTIIIKDNNYKTIEKYAIKIK